jgi:DNA-binding HxlR family transcriptional regulator
LEHVLLEHLRFAPSTRAELVRRTGMGNQRVQAALDTLVREAFVVRRPQDDGPEDYELTEAGTGRLGVFLDLTNRSGPDTPSRRTRGRHGVRVGG